METILEKNYFHFKKCPLKKFVLSWVSELWIYILNLTSLASILTYIFMSGSGSKLGLNTDPIRIRIHNTVYLYELTIRIWSVMTFSQPWLRSSLRSWGNFLLVRSFSRSWLDTDSHWAVTIDSGCWILPMSGQEISRKVVVWFWADGLGLRYGSSELGRALRWHLFWRANELGLWQRQHCLRRKHHQPVEEQPGAAQRILVHCHGAVR